MENDLRQIFNEILTLFRNDLSNSEVNSSASFKFVFFHNRVSNYQLSKEFIDSCNRVLDELIRVSASSAELDKNTFFLYYVAELVTQNMTIENLSFFDVIMEKVVSTEINKIIKWHSSKEKKYSISLLLNTDFKMNSSVDDWVRRDWDRRKSALAGYRSGIAEMMFFHSYVDAFWLTKEYKLVPEWEKLIDDFSVLRLSLSLTVKERIVIHDVQIENTDWEMCPFLPVNFMKRWGHLEELKTDIDSARFFLNNFAHGRSGQAFSHERVLDNNLFFKWKTVVLDRKYRAAFHHIFNGLSDILKSHNYRNFNENFISSDGLTKVFIGLDGMLEDEESRRANLTAFVNFWQPIFLKVVPSISKKKTKRIYSLRCALLHGDYEDFIYKCSEVYKIICPNAKETKVSTQHFAFNFASFIVRVIQVVEKSPELLKPSMQKISMLDKFLSFFKF